MKIFETDRLIVRKLNKTDSDDYYDMMGNPKVMSLIPRQVMSRKESDKHLKDFMGSDQQQSNTKVWGVELKDRKEFIGLCAFLKNNEDEDEIGYRLREEFWGKGFGTEITKELISFGFEKMKMEKITADVDTNNLNSVQILEKFMSSEKEFFNESDDCIDRRYIILKNNGLQQRV
jgi:ribosomal-protein-alanine N-acetyltransferase